MTERGATAARLDPDDVQRILAVCSPGGLLVGGQALAFWAENLQVRLPGALASGVTADADFIGDAALAAQLAKRLRWKLHVPSADDATPQTAKVSHRLADGRIKQVDFLTGVIGLSTKDLQRRAMEVAIPGVGRLRVLHPIDVLDSRIQNLHVLPEKRDAAGRAQASLAIAVVNRFIRRRIEDHGERAALALLERIVKLALARPAVRCFVDFGIDLIAAVPIEEFRLTPRLHSTRWPQLMKDVARVRRAALARALNRRK